MIPLTDPDIRDALLARLQILPGLWFRSEMVLGRAIADVVTISDLEIHAFEIKSDVDSLTRLPDQVECYGRVCDRATLVVGPRHKEKGVVLIPPWWGVLEAQGGDSGVILTEVRVPGLNPKVNWVPTFNLLWRNEAQEVCERHGIARGIRGRSKPVIKRHLRVKHKFPLEDLRKDVRDIIRNRIWNLG